MVDDGHFIQAAKGGAERILTQEEIDSLLGFSPADVSLNDNSGIRAIIDSAMVSYERLPMLEIIFDRLVRLMTTSLRNFTSDNVEVSLDRIPSVASAITSKRCRCPPFSACSKPRSGRISASITVNSSLIYSIIDVLLGGRRGQTAVRIEGRPYTTIETNLVKRMIEVVLADAELAFKPLSPVKLNIDRLETNPRFAAISRPANAAILVRLRIDMEDRGGTIELLLPYATINRSAKCCCRCSWARNSAATRLGKAISPPRSGRREIAVECRALRGAAAAASDHEARCRRHADARSQVGRAW